MMIFEMVFCIVGAYAFYFHLKHRIHIPLSERDRLHELLSAWITARNQRTEYEVYELKYSRYITHLDFDDQYLCLIRQEIGAYDFLRIHATPYFLEVHVGEGEMSRINDLYNFLPHE
jgi:hypothetical protein